MVSPLRILLPVLLLAASCIGTPESALETGPPSVAPEPSVSAEEARTYLEKLACGIPRSELLRVWRGTDPRRSGEIQLITKEPNVIGNWFPHSGPWEHLQRVPMLWYGPGHVPAVGAVSRPATMADVAPTIAELLNFDFTAPDGRPMTEAVLPPEESDGPPKLVLVVVWDGGGRNVMEEYPTAWPVVRGLIPRGAWFEGFTVGSSPSITPAIHATLGTGAFPRRHGVVDARYRLGKELARPEYTWPQVLRTPTLADLYDREMGNVPKIGVVASLNWHLTMIGSGARFQGGDKDLAILKASKQWGLAPQERGLYETRTYPNRVPGLDAAIRRMDIADGRLDGVWLGEDFRAKPQMLPRTPAYTEWQTRILREVIRREGFGADDVPDILFTNYKQIDLVGHSESMNSPQMRSVLHASDEALGDLVRILDREVGRGEWVLALTADHGATPHPRASGAVFMVPKSLGEDIRAAFDDGDSRDVIEAIRPTEMWMDVDELRSNGFTLTDVARFLSRYTRKQLDKQPADLSEEQRNERMFSLAIPGRMLLRLPCLASDER